MSQQSSSSVGSTDLGSSDSENSIGDLLGFEKTRSRPRNDSLHSSEDTNPSPHENSHAQPTRQPSSSKSQGVFLPNPLSLKAQLNVGGALSTSPRRTAPDSAISSSSSAYGTPRSPRPPRKFNRMSSIISDAGGEHTHGSGESSNDLLGRAESLLQQAKGQKKETETAKEKSGYQLESARQQQEEEQKNRQVRFLSTLQDGKGQATVLDPTTKIQGQEDNRAKTPLKLSTPVEAQVPISPINTDVEDVGFSNRSASSSPRPLGNRNAPSPRPLSARHQQQLSVTNDRLPSGNSAQSLKQKTSMEAGGEAFSVYSQDQVAQLFQRISALESRLLEQESNSGNAGGLPTEEAASPLTLPANVSPRRGRHRPQSAASLPRQKPKNTPFRRSQTSPSPQAGEQPKLPRPPVPSRVLRQKKKKKKTVRRRSTSPEYGKQDEDYLGYKYPPQHPQHPQQSIGDMLLQPVVPTAYGGKIVLEGAEHVPYNEEEVDDIIEFWRNGGAGEPPGEAPRVEYRPPSTQYRKTSAQSIQGTRRQGSRRRARPTSAHTYNHPSRAGSFSFAVERINEERTQSAGRYRSPLSQDPGEHEEQPRRKPKKKTRRQIWKEQTKKYYEYMSQPRMVGTPKLAVEPKAYPKVDPNLYEWNEEGKKYLKSEAPPPLRTKPKVLNAWAAHLEQAEAKKHEWTGEQTEGQYPNSRLSDAAKKYAKMQQAHRGQGPKPANPLDAPYTWSELRQLKEGEVVVTVEHCIGCEKHQLSFQHDEAEFRAKAQKVLHKVANELALFAIKFGGALYPAQGLQDFHRWNAKTSRRFMSQNQRGEVANRIGAFEVQVAFCSPKLSGQLQVELIHSKLKDRCFPVPGVCAKKIANTLNAHYISAEEESPENILEEQEVNSTIQWFFDQRKRKQQEEQAKEEAVRKQIEHFKVESLEELQVSQEEELKMWLYRVNPSLVQYTQALINEGFDSLQALVLMKASDVVCIRGIKRGHGNLLIAALRQLRKEQGAASPTEHEEDQAFQSESIASSREEQPPSESPKETGGSTPHSARSASSLNPPPSARSNRLPSTRSAGRLQPSAPPSAKSSRLSSPRSAGSLQPTAPPSARSVVSARSFRQQQQEESGTNDSDSDEEDRGKMPEANSSNDDVIKPQSDASIQSNENAVGPPSDPVEGAIENYNDVKNDESEPPSDTDANAEIKQPVEGAVENDNNVKNDESEPLSGTDSDAENKQPVEGAVENDNHVKNDECELLSGTDADAENKNDSSGTDASEEEDAEDEDEDEDGEDETKRPKDEVFVLNAKEGTVEVYNGEASAKAAHGTSDQNIESSNTNESDPGPKYDEDFADESNRMDRATPAMGQEAETEGQEDSTAANQENQESNASIEYEGHTDPIEANQESNATIETEGQSNPTPMHQQSTSSIDYEGQTDPIKANQESNATIETEGVNEPTAAHQESNKSTEVEGQTDPVEANQESSATIETEGQSNPTPVRNSSVEHEEQANSMKANQESSATIETEGGNNQTTANQESNTSIESGDETDEPEDNGRQVDAPNKVESSAVEDDNDDYEEDFGEESAKPSPSVLEKAEASASDYEDDFNNDDKHANQDAGNTVEQSGNSYGDDDFDDADSKQHANQDAGNAVEQSGNSYGDDDFDDADSKQDANQDPEKVVEQSANSYADDDFDDAESKQDVNQDTTNNVEQSGDSYGDDFDDDGQEGKESDKEDESSKSGYSDDFDDGEAPPTEKEYQQVQEIDRVKALKDAAAAAENDEDSPFASSESEATLLTAVSNQSAMEPEMVAAKRLRNRLNRVAQQLSGGKPGGLKMLYAMLDADASGTLETSEFRRTLREVGIRLNKKETEAVLACFDTNGDGTINFPEFRSFLLSSPGDEEIGHIWMKIRTACMDNDMEISSLDSTIFEKYDKGDTKYELPVDDFLQALEEIEGLKLHQKEKDVIINRFSGRTINRMYSQKSFEIPEDREMDVSDQTIPHDGQINYLMFNSWLCPIDVIKLSKRISRFLRAVGNMADDDDDEGSHGEKSSQKDSGFLKMFQQMDEDGSGDIDLKELKKMINDLGLPITDIEARTLILHYDGNHDGKMNYQEFAALVDRPTRPTT